VHLQFTLKCHGISDACDDLIQIRRAELVHPPKRFTSGSHQQIERELYNGMQPTQNTSRRFPLGRVVGTPGAIASLEQTGQAAASFLARHVSGDWGDVPPEDAAENEISIEQSLRILSAYQLTDQTRIWVITEADRSATTILLPEEY
jgi:hypothetical protein